MARRWRACGIVAIALAITVALAGCGSGGATSSPSADQTVPTLRPTPVTSGSANPTAAPTVVAPTLVPVPEPMAATPLDPHLAVRVDIRPDVTAGRVPTLSVYRDGTVLRLSDFGADVIRLSAAGLSEVLEVAAGSGLLEGDDIDPDPGYAAGFVTYTITLDRAGTLVGRSVVNAYPASRRDEAERFITLAERLADLETWLPSAAWLNGPGDSEPWVPDRYLLKVTDWGYAPDVASPVDIADIVWPLDAGPLEIGEAVELDELGAAGHRCAVLPLAAARWLEAAAFGEQPPGYGIPAEYVAVDLAWAARTSFLSLSLRALLPDEPSDCGVDLGWP